MSKSMTHARGYTAGLPEWANAWSHTPTDELDAAWPVRVIGTTVARTGERLVHLEGDGEAGPEIYSPWFDGVLNGGRTGDTVAVRAFAQLLLDAADALDAIRS